MNNRTAGYHILPQVHCQSPALLLSGHDLKSFSEDPHENSTIAAAYTNSQRSKGTAATTKCHTANQQEPKRLPVFKLVDG